MPSEGELMFAPILRALREGGYVGMAAIEPFIYQPDGPRVRRARHRSRARALGSRLNSSSPIPSRVPDTRWRMARVPWTWQRARAPLHIHHQTF